MLTSSLNAMLTLSNTAYLHKAVFISVILFLLSQYISPKAFSLPSLNGSHISAWFLLILLLLRGVYCPLGGGWVTLVIGFATIP